MERVKKNPTTCLGCGVCVVLLLLTRYPPFLPVRSRPSVRSVPVTPATIAAMQCDSSMGAIMLEAPGDVNTRKFSYLCYQNPAGGGVQNDRFVKSKLMLPMGWRSSIHMLFLRTGIRGLMYRKKWRGSRGDELREAKQKRDKGRENSSPRRKWRGPCARAVIRIRGYCLQHCVRIRQICCIPLPDSNFNNNRPCR